MSTHRTLFILDAALALPELELVRELELALERKFFSPPRPDWRAPRSLPSGLLGPCGVQMLYS